MERWRDHDDEVDWRQVFVERYKLRRAWMGGQCHVRTFEGHTGGISCVQFDGGRIVSGSHDKMIKVWDLNTMRCRHTLKGHSSRVRALAISGNLLFSGSNDKSIKVWNLDSYSNSHSLDALSPSRRRR